MHITTVEFFIQRSTDPRFIFTEMRTSDAYHEHMIGHLAGIITTLLSDPQSYDNANGYDIFGLSTDVPAHVSWPRRRLAKGLIPVGEKYIFDNYLALVEDRWMGLELEDKRVAVFSVDQNERVELATIRLGWGRGQKPRDMVR